MGCYTSLLVGRSKKISKFGKVTITFTWHIKFVHTLGIIEKTYYSITKQIFKSKWLKYHTYINKNLAILILSKLCKLCTNYLSVN